MDIKIIFEDDQLIVIDKPSGIVVNRSETAKEQTIHDWAEDYIGIKNSKSRIGNEKQENNNGDQTIEDEFRSRGGVVHRLDKETSGILIIAKNPKAFSELKNQFKERRVEKTYFALVHGEVKPEEGEINVPIGRLSYNRKRFGVVAGGREAVTKYKVLSIKYLVSNGKKEPVSLLELYPKTGRTHQIRVHLKHIDHPIFSDLLYAGRKTARSDRKILDRLFLHATEIKFIHPIKKKIVEFESSLPVELKNFLSQLN